MSKEEVLFAWVRVEPLRCRWTELVTADNVAPTVRAGNAAGGLSSKTAL